ncbi:DUF2157 domain-containing protein [Trichloromonas sp.]|uniref:DUF2157 domain-containing protein n=1 Tax=Trichloromonas sp. TaxID=3069249 RepID=UPI003D81B7E2
MSKKAIRWLYDELPNLVAGQVLTAADAERLQDHYGALDDDGRPSLGLVICSILGATLIGLGIILVFAHNWAELSRPLRAFLSFAPLLAGQLLVGWVLLRRQDSRAWCEGSAVFLMAAVGAAIALVGQTYHISGDPEAFVLSWMLLGLPLSYLLRASAPVAFYWVGISCWAWMAHDWAGSGNQLWFWALAALAAPPVWQTVRRDPRSPRAAFLLWVVGICLCIGYGLSFKQGLGGGWILGYGGLLASFYLFDTGWPQQVSGWRRPWHVIGSLGIVVLSLLLTFETWSRRANWDRLAELWAQDPWLAAHWLLQSTLTLLLVGLAFWLLQRRLRSGRRDGLLFAAVAPLALVCYLLALFDVEGGALLAFNIYLAVLGVGTLRSGLRSGRLIQVNGGLVIITALIAARFFDSDLPFTVRVVLFILIGVGFLAANILAKKNRGAK